MKVLSKIINKISIPKSFINNYIKNAITFYSKESNANEYYNLIDSINDKLGRTAILRASSLLNNSTIKNRERFKNII